MAGSAEVTLIDPGTRRAVRSIREPATGRLYLPVGRAPATDFGGRAVPGFAVLVVEAK
jgi:hypothetical protein